MPRKIAKDTCNGQGGLPSNDPAQNSLVPEGVFMRMNLRFQIVIVSALFATAALADEIPSRKPGGWEVATKGEALPNVTLKLCIDKDTDQLFHKIGTEVTERCSSRDVKVEDNVATINSQCKIGNSKITGKMVMTFSGDTAFHSELKSHFEPPFKGMSDATATQDGKWIGACAAGMKPGDFALGEGIKMNIKMLETMRKFLQ
jgi:Protein of unknown function (DUF3617)